MSKLYEKKVVKLQSYSSIELLYLLQDVLKELTNRTSRASKIHSEMDKGLSTIYHRIEFNEFNKTEKINVFDTLKQHLNKRRIAKNEVYTLQRFGDNINVNQIYGKLGKVIADTQSQMHLKSKEPVYTPQGTFTRFYLEYMTDGQGVVSKAVGDGNE